mgnify:CR=1 FL=1
MLGDVAIFGNFSCGVDEKSRIILPAYTDAEKGDKVVFCISDIGEDAIDLYPLSTISELISRCDELILTSTDDSIVARAKNEKRRLCGSTLVQTKVDAHRRLTVNPVVREILGVDSDKYYGLGENDRIKLFSNEEKFKEYVGHSYVKKA